MVQLLLRSPSVSGRRWMAVAGIAFAAGAGVAGWGLLVEPRMLQQRHIDVRLPNLPDAWHNRELALFADLQVGMPLANIQTVRRAVAAVVARRPAAVLIAGDFLYDPADHHAALEQVIDLLRPLMRLGVPCLGVLGNHDFDGAPGAGAPRALAEEVVRALEGLGIRILRNEAVSVSIHEQTLYVVGIGERSAHRDDWRAAFASVPVEAPRVVLAHDPAALRAIPSGWAPLALAGHTHGGQIRVPGQPELAPARLTSPWPEYVDGWIDDYLPRGNRLYVNRGIGFSRWPIRIGAPPEVTFIRLRTPGAIRAST